MAVRHERLLYADERLAQPQLSRTDTAATSGTRSAPSSTTTSIVRMSPTLSSGSSSTMIRSARRPAAIVPNSASFPRHVAPFAVAASRIAALGTPARSEAWRGRSESDPPPHPRLDRRPWQSHRAAGLMPAAQCCSTMQTGHTHRQHYGVRGWGEPDRYRR